MRLTVVLALLVGCKDKQAAQPSTATASIDWAQCERALGSPAMFGACPVCDWDPILRWNVPTAQGGPTRTEIERAMESCKAFCNGEARLKFLGTLDDARGSTARTPWRQLGQSCKDAVSAAPDQRFMSGHYFALDRIARAVAARAARAKVVVPLPPVTVVGTGVPLAEADAGIAPPVGGVQITLLGDGIFVGRLPKATLGAGGVNVDLGPDGYPGRQVTLDELRGAVEALGTSELVVLLAPKVLPSKALGPVLEKLSGINVHLAVVPRDAPKEWAIPRALPTPLRTEALGQTTVQELAIVPP